MRRPATLPAFTEAAPLAVPVVDALGVAAPEAPVPVAVTVPEAAEPLAEVPVVPAVAGVAPFALAW